MRRKTGCSLGAFMVISNNNILNFKNKKPLPLLAKTAADEKHSVTTICLYFTASCTFFGIWLSQQENRPLCLKCPSWSNSYSNEEAQLKCFLQEALSDSSWKSTLRYNNVLLRYQGNDVSNSHIRWVPVFNPLVPQLLLHWARAMWLSRTNRM